MNKLIIDKENNIDIKDNALILDIKVNNLTINCEGKVLLQEVDNKDLEELNLTINLLPNSSLVYNRFMIHNKMNNEITINQDKDSKVMFNYSIIANDENKLKFNSNLLSDNNETEIKVSAVTENKGKIVVESTALTKPKIKDNNLLESIKVLVLNNEESVCIPNLLVASNEVEVNHAATISGVDKDYLFYLNSKGISNEGAIKLIKSGYLLSNLASNKELNEQIKELIGGE